MSLETVGNVISVKDPMLIVTFEQVIAEIECSLSNLRYLALSTDFSKSEQRQCYHDNVSYLKRFYERAERIVTDDVDGSANSPATNGSMGG